MSTPGLHSGIITHQGETLNLPSHMDKRHLAALEGPKQPSHLGTLDIWAFKKKVDVPFLAVAGIGSNNIMYVDGDSFTYDVASTNDVRVRIIQDITPDGPVGKGKSEFEILVNSDQIGGSGQIFKFDKLGREEFMVTRPLRKSGKHFVATVKKTSDSEPVNKMWLQPGVSIYTELPAAISPEFGQSYASKSLVSTSNPKYIVPVGKFVHQTSYSVSTEVAKINKLTISGDKKKQLDRVMEYYFSVQDAAIASSGATELGMITSKPELGSAFKDAMNSGRVSVAINTLYDSWCMKELARNETNYQMYGSGGIISASGVDEFLAPVGAWHQLDTGYKTTFNIADFDLVTLEAALQEYYNGKVDMPGPGSEPVLTVQTGKGGFELMKRIIQKQVNNEAIVVHAKDFGNLVGNADGLAFKTSWYDAITIRMLATLRFVYNPALDPIDDNEITNPIVGAGYRLSSYSMIIHEVNDFGGNGNIKLIRSKDTGNQVYMNVVAGRNATHPLLQKNGPNGAIMIESGSRENGYSVSFEKQMDSLFIVDPTRVLKLVPQNPLTGNTF